MATAGAGKNLWWAKENDEDNLYNRERSILRREYLSKGIDVINMTSFIHEVGEPDNDGYTEILRVAVLFKQEGGMFLTIHEKSWEDGRVRDNWYEYMHTTKIEDLEKREQKIAEKLLTTDPKEFPDIRV